MNAINAYVHTEQDRYHYNHGHPDAKQTLKLRSPRRISLNTEDPSVKNAVTHDKEDAENRRYRRSGSSLCVIALAVYVEDWNQINDSHHSNHYICEIGYRTVGNMLFNVASKMVSSRLIHKVVALCWIAATTISLVLHNI